MTKQVVRGWIRVDREVFAAYCRERGVRGDARSLLLLLLVEADDRTGVIQGDLHAIATELLGMSRYQLRRRLPPLEAAGVVRVERSNAPEQGAIVIVDYAALDPTSRLARRVSGGSRAGVGRESGDSATTLQQERTAIQKDRRTEVPPPPLPVSSGPNGLGPAGRGDDLEQLARDAAERQADRRQLTNRPAWVQQATRTLLGHATALLAEQPALGVAHAVAIAAGASPPVVAAAERPTCDSCGHHLDVPSTCALALDGDCPHDREPPR